MRSISVRSNQMKQGGSYMRTLASNLAFSLASIAAVTFLGVPGLVAQDQTGPQEVPQETIEQHVEVRKAASKQAVEQNAEADPSGNDPRVFSNKWMPFYRYIELENGLVQNDLTAFGTVAFSRTVGMFYEVSLASQRDFSDVSGFPPEAESSPIGMGDVSLKFLVRPRALDFHYGDEGKMSGSVLYGMDYVLPTATEDALGGDAFVFAPIVALVLDMPVHGFFAMLNLYYFDVYKNDSAPDTSRYVGRWFYMQPLTKPGPWWGGVFLMPEFQPIYDFETEDASLWIGVEFGKIAGAGKIAYVKPGWGIDNSEATDRKSTIEAGFRWFF
jgi:hypothetical protein